MAWLDLIGRPSRVAIAVVIALVVLAVLLLTTGMKILVWPDSIAYLGPPLDALTTGTFTHWGGRGFGYPAWLWAVLSWRFQVADVIVGQRALVLFTGLALGCAIVVTSRPVAHRPAVALLAGFWMLVYVLYPPVIGLAHAIMPETLFAFVLSLIVLAVTVALSSDTSRGAAIAATVVTGIAAAALVVVKPHATLLAAFLIAALPWPGPPPRRRDRIWALGASVVLAGVLVILPESVLQERYDARASQLFGPQSLFCNNADLVQSSLDSNDPFERTVRESLGAILSPEARRRASDWTLLGFNGDACMYGEPPRLVDAHFPDANAAVAFYQRTYIRAALARPQHVLARLVRHAADFAYKPFNAVTTAYFFTATPSMMSVDFSHQSVLKRWYADDPGRFDGLVSLPTRRWLMPLRVLFVCAGTLLIASSVVAAFLTPNDALRQTFLILLGCALSINVLIAIVHTFEPRYMAMQTPLLAAVGFAGSLAIMEWIRRRFSAVA